MLRSALEFNRAQARVAAAGAVAMRTLPFERAMRLLVALQATSARASEVAVDAMLAEQGVDLPSGHVVNARAIVGRTGAGIPLADVFTAEAEKEFRAIVAVTVLHDTARQAATAAMVARGVTAYVRQTDGSPCGRCAILAGRVYRWSDGFLRHPHCGCTHVPTTSAKAKKVQADPLAYFESLSPLEQDSRFGKAVADRIRGGEDIFRAVNSARRSARVSVASRTGRTPQAIVQVAPSVDAARAALVRSGVLVAR